MTMEALESGSLRYLDSDNFIYYRIDKGPWLMLEPWNDVVIEKGQIIEFKGVYKIIGDVRMLTTTFKCKLSGNSLSLIFGDDFKGKDDLSAYPQAFEFLFSYCDVTDVTADFLPATTLAYRCYGDMFYGCTSLTTAPVLPATQLAQSCYSNMFQNCSKLNYIKMLATDISATDCLFKWVDGVASTGTFVKNKNATWNVTGSSGVPSGWTIQKV